jgi:PIN domain nuclease of toxin-antitoxin system
MDMDMDPTRPPVQESFEEAVILLDTNALIWSQRNDPRTRSLGRIHGRLYISPASLLEMQILAEGGRLRARGDASPRDLVRDERWALDEPPSATWFDAALDVGWTHDVFDRLLVAHARMRRWRLATSDTTIIENLSPNEYLEL